MRLALSVLIVSATLAGAVRAQPVPCAEVYELNSVYFIFATATLMPDTEERMEENMTVLGPCPDLGVLVEAVTDEDEMMADALSELRAQVVARWYLAHGVEAFRLAARGVGEDRDSFAEEDPGPGDIRARRADSTPMLIADLPPDALGWADVPRTDPAPVEQELAEGITLMLDWDLAADSGADLDACPDDPRGDSVLTLAAAAVTVDGRRTDLDATCLRSAWPGSGFLGAETARVAPGVALVRGTVSPTGAPEAVVWLVGPDGGRRLDDDPCLASEAYAAALALDLRALAEAERAGDTGGARRAADAAVANGGAVLSRAGLVTGVGGPADVRRLDCTPVFPHFDH